MSRTIPHPNPAPGFTEHPEHRIEIETDGRRVRALFAGKVVADGARALVLHESGYEPVTYFPRDDVRMDLMSRSDHGTVCPFKGRASYWTLAAGGRTAENAAWSYEAPYDEVLRIKDHVAFYRDLLDGIDGIEE